MYVSVAGPPLPSGRVAKRFFRSYRKVDKKPVTPYAVYAAQAAQVLLSAIARSNGTRASVTAQLFKTKVKKGIMGTFRIDKNGDTTLKGITVYRVRNGNGVPYKLFFPPLSLTK
jgi:branched-chain amino acid transport system substrate-binding protein